MIWIWITAALAISLLIPNKHKISWYNYLFFLFPIENYGISLAGAVIKPYLIFGLLIIIAGVKNSGLKQSKTLVFIFMLVIISDALNGLVAASIMQHILFMLLCVISYFYFVLAEKNKLWFEELSDVLVSLLIGYGVVFVIAGTLLNSGIMIPGIIGSKSEDSMFMRYIQIGGAYIYRLRGFTIDTNSSLTSFLPGFAILVSDCFSEKKNLSFAKKIVGFTIFILCVILTSSRMAQLFTLILVVMTLVNAYKKSQKKRHWVYLSLVLVFVLLANVIFSKTNIISLIRDFIVSSYTQRSGLTDEAGRFTIWITNFRELFATSRIWFGVGQNQIQYYSPISKPFHSTWFEWIAGTGIFIGLVLDYWCISAPFLMIKQIRQKRLDSSKWMPLIIASISILICLTAVDHIINPNLIMITVAFHCAASRAKNKDNKRECMYEVSP